MSAPALALASVLLLLASPAGSVPCRDWSIAPPGIDAPGGVRDFERVGDVLHAARPVSDAGILWMDVSNPELPVSLGSLDVGDDVHGLSASGGWMYAAAGPTIVVVDVSNPAAPFVAGSVARPSIDVAVDGTRLYSVSSGSLDVFDITLPTAPALLGSTPAPESPPQDPAWYWLLRTVEVAGPDEVIVGASSIDGAFGGDPLALAARVDVTDPNAADFEMGSLVLGGGGQCGGGGSWHVNLGTVVVGAYTATSCAPTYNAVFACRDLAGAVPRGLVGLAVPESYSGDLVTLTPTTALWSVRVGQADPGFYVVDFSNLEAPALGPLVPHDTIYGQITLVDDDLVYAATEEIEVIRYDGAAAESVFPPPGPEPLGLYEPGTTASRLATSGSTLWRLGQSGTPFLETVDVADATAPAAIGLLALPPGSADALAVASFGALVGSDDTVRSIDGTVPAAPALLGSYTHTAGIRDIASEGDFAHVAAADGYLRLDVSDPTTPAFDDFEPLAGAAHGVGVWDGYAYLVRSDGATAGFLDMVQLGNNAMLRHTVGIPGNPAGLEILSGLAYVPTSSGLTIYSLPADGAGPEPPPTLVGDVALPDACSEVALAGDYAYLAATGRTFVVDVTDPASPAYVGSWEGDGDNVAIGPHGEIWVGGARLASVGPQCTADAVGVNATPAAPTTMRVAPNPTRGRTTISFETRGNAYVRLGIFDVSGRRVATVWEGAPSEGAHHVVWNAPSRLASGAYFVRLETRRVTEAVRLVLTR